MEKWYSIQAETKIKQGSHTYTHKTDFKPKIVIRGKEGQYIMIKELIHPKDMTVINICKLNIGAPKCIKQTLTD